MSDLRILRDQLEKLLAISDNRVSEPSWMDGDKADERRAFDDLRSGAVAFRAANEHARRGLEALDGGEAEYATAALREGKHFLAEAFERQLTSDGLKKLRTGAGRRGRPATTKDRNAAAADAVIEQEAKGISRKAARDAAIRSNPDLDEAFRGLTDETIKKSVRKGRNR
ncbi:hypothetical protein [Hyphomicrobium sp. DY-1]|uniref:hypothetical protein n=1 Tax=Hyphomicrobium sp. DY-1 TaxID=3075650 RepID=UPI0039C2E398